MAASSRQRVLSVYRQLFRQQATTFANDPFVQQNARREIRAQFRAKRSLAEAKEVEEAVTAAQEALDYLRTSVIQAKRVKGDHFGQRSSNTHSPLPTSTAADDRRCADLLLSSPLFPLFSVVAVAKIRPEQTVKDPQAVSAALTAPQACRLLTKSSPTALLTRCCFPLCNSLCARPMVQSLAGVLPLPLCEIRCIDCSCRSIDHLTVTKCLAGLFQCFLYAACTAWRGTRLPNSAAC